MDLAAALMTHASHGTRPVYFPALVLRFFFLFFPGIFILSFPFSYHLLPDIGAYTTKLIAPLAGGLLHIGWPGRSFEKDITSDAALMYASLPVAAGIAAVLAFPAARIARRGQISLAAVKRFCTVCASYYLALHMWKYGFNKLCCWQFPLPEPNLLFTRLGNIPKDMLYWSTVGISPAYSWCSGLMEVIPAFMLCARKTRALGAFLLTGVMGHVVWINFSYDISVKVYSCFLLLLSLALALPVFRLLVDFFLSGKTVVPETPVVTARSPARISILHAAKAALIGCLLLEALWPYLRSGNFQDYLAARPPLHGAWQVTSFVHNGDTLLPGQGSWDRFFVHRRGYFIAQTGEAMEDYKLYTDTGTRALVLEAYETEAFASLSYRLHADSLLEINGLFFGDTLAVHARKINLDSMPLMRREFHWITDP